MKGKQPAPANMLCMAADVRDELETMIRARYPIVYVLSYEEERVEEAVRVVANDLQYKVYVWSLIEGMRPETPGPPPATKLAPELEALAQIKRIEPNSVVLLKDYHTYLNDYRVTRFLRDLDYELPTKRQTLIILGPILRLPPELEKDVTVLDFGLPTPEEINETLHDVLIDARDNSKLNLDLTPEQREAIIHASQGLTIAEIKNVLLRSLIRRRALDIGEILFEKQQLIRKSGILEYFPPEVTLADVGGLNLLKKWLRNRTTAFTQKARDFGLPSPKGVLLLGVQGCGKSLSAKTIGALWNLPVLRLDVGRVFAGLVGQSEENMRKALRVADSVAPCVLWIDELEKGLSGAESSGASDGGTMARVFATFLTWMQDKTSPVFVVATANDVSKLPPELLRKGRFDEIFFIDLPDDKERREIVTIHLKKRKRDPAKFDIPKLSLAMAGFSGAEIEQVIVGALFSAFNADREITTADVEREAKAIVPLSVMMREDIDALRTWAHLRARRASGPEPLEEKQLAKASDQKVEKKPRKVTAGEKQAQ